MLFLLHDVHFPPPSMLHSLYEVNNLIPCASAHAGEALVSQLPQLVQVFLDSYRTKYFFALHGHGNAELQTGI